MCTFDAPSVRDTFLYSADEPMCATETQRTWVKRIIDLPLTKDCSCGLFTRRESDNWNQAIRAKFSLLFYELASES